MTVCRAGFISCLLALGVTVSPVDAQRLQSDREGSQIAIQGRISITGVMPLSVDALPPGSYRLTTWGVGHPRAQGKLDRSLQGRLTTSRLNGPEVLLMPPGGAHLGNPSDRSRGFLFLGSSAFTLTNALLKNGDVSKANDAVAVAQNLYDRAVSEDAIRDARVQLEVSAQRVDDEKELRTLWMGASAYLWMGAALEAWVLTPKPELEPMAGGYQVKTPRVTGAGAALRSLLSPGGGQRYVGSTGRGNWFLAGVSLFTMGTLYAQEQYLEKNRDQLRIQREFDLTTDQEDLERLRGDLQAAQDDVRTAEITRWVLAGLAAGTYVWNILDAATLDVSAGESTDLSLQLVPTGDGLQAQVRWGIN